MHSSRCLRLFALVGLIVCATLGFSQRGGQRDGSIDRFTANLSRGGFNWAEGSMIQLDPAQLCCAGKLPGGLYFNKLTPYVGVKLPPIQAPLPLFQLRPDEAVVVIGVTPPEAKYFGYQLYLIERVFPPTTEGLPGTRKLLFASAGDAVNLRTLRTLGPDPFNRAVVFLFTPDQGTEARVHAALRSAGYPDAIINTVVVPAPMLNLGLDPDKNDVMLILHRMAMFADPDAGEQYVNAFNSDHPPLRAFRITPRNSGSLRLFPTPPLRIRGTGHTEMDLTAGLDQLRQAILDVNKGYKATEYATRPIAYDGFDFIQRGANALGDTRDALYLGAGWLPEFGLDDPARDTLTLGDNEFLIAYGPQHVATGKAIYSNINAYASDPQLPLGSVFYDKFEKSADGYVPGADLMYVYKIKRHCNGEQFCMELTPPPYQPCTPKCETWPDCPPFTLNDSTKLGIAWRNYVEPHTNVGNPFTEVLYDRLIKFSPQ